MEEQAPILIATPAALLQKVIPKEQFKRSYLYLVAGQELARDGLLQHLVQWGFQNVPLVEERGDFSVRGGIVDIFSLDMRARCGWSSMATDWNRSGNSARPISVPSSPRKKCFCCR